MNKHEPHFACVRCAEHFTYPADCLRRHDDGLWCDHCWYEYNRDTETGIEHHDLPPFIPEADQKIQALTEGLQAIKQHLEIMGAGNLGAAWNIADAALKKAEAIGK